MTMLQQAIGRPQLRPCCDIAARGSAPGRRTFLEAALETLAAGSTPSRAAGIGAAVAPHPVRSALADDRHTVLVLNPGHFHAALTLRRRHPRLHDDVYVYAEDGPDVESFLRIVGTFNERAQDPTAWNLRVYRGADYMERLLSERAGDVVIVAGKNDAKMSSIHRLHAEGFYVLGDKPWLIGTHELAMLREIAATAPVAMDIMTERHAVATQVQKALSLRPDVFGSFQSTGDEPAVYMRSVHHLYKIVNERPLVRPAWFFDTAVQGEGMMDVTTHLADLVQWMSGRGKPLDYARDIDLVSAAQWTTEVPKDLFMRITGLPDFPAAIRGNVSNGVLQYLCNASLSYRTRGIPAQIESVWALAIPAGGGDTHRGVLRGTAGELTIDQSAATRFVPELTVRPTRRSKDYAGALAHAVASLQDGFPGLGLEPAGDGFRIVIPEALRTTHEQHFAAVLDEFIAYIDRGECPPEFAPDLVGKYTLLAQARERSRRSV